MSGPFKPKRRYNRRRVTFPTQLKSKKCSLCRLLAVIKIKDFYLCKEHHHAYLRGPLAYMPKFERASA